jgi:hypothetical protein
MNTENIIVSEKTNQQAAQAAQAAPAQAAQAQAAQAPAAPAAEFKLVDATIADQNTALNVLVGFIGVAQKRGCFALDESAKIYECVKMFQGAASSN